MFIKIIGARERKGQYNKWEDYPTGLILFIRIVSHQIIYLLLCAIYILYPKYRYILCILYVYILYFLLTFVLFIYSWYCILSRNLLYIYCTVKCSILRRFTSLKVWRCLFFNNKYPRRSCYVIFVPWCPKYFTWILNSTFGFLYVDPET